jgi:hypothetical protein
MGYGFGGAPPLFTFVLFLIIGVIILMIIAGIVNFAKNASSPILTTNARIVTKRMDVTHHHNINNETHISNSTSSTRYYVTFETEAGQRIELTVSGREYGLLVEGDEGELIYQGEWYKQFKRSM